MTSQRISDEELRRATNRQFRVSPPSHSAFSTRKFPI